MQVDYIIVGQGIAGTVLSYILLSRGKKVLVIDKGHSGTSSKAAAGIYNPVTGKRLTKTWEADTLFPFLLNVYTSMEKELDASFLRPMPIYRPFTSIEEQNHWTAKTASPELIPYTETRLDHQKYATSIYNPYGGLLIKQSGCVEVAVMLEAFKHYLINRQAYLQESFTYEDIVLAKEYVTWNGIKANKILFCEGTFNEKNPYFHWLPFKYVKGELLIVHIPQFTIEEEIINRGIFILPMGKQLFKVGATYVWDDLTLETTESAKNELGTKLKELIRVPFEIVDHIAGIRPASSDRRPFIGLHPEHPVLGIFNGLGTKGVSLAPYFANQFVEYLEDGKDLHKEVHINRYFSLYYKTKS